MVKAIFYKEWLKTRVCLLIALVTEIGFAGFSTVRMWRVASLKGAAHVWEVMLTRDALFVDTMTYIPLLAGAVLALVQFMPEMHRKSLKLTLHLPCPHFTMLMSMLAFGVVSLALCFAAALTVIWLAASPLLAVELCRGILLTALVWHAAGIAAYLLAAWITLEPTWKRRMFDLLISAAVMRIYFLSHTPGAYNGFLPVLMLFTLLLAALPGVSVARFREGKQD